mmetsp:Transcript_5692/g.25297  ORF Transcript_5692/g.25297 Transcript_5692/m.25297 type:complete len:303 (+) Transcript_5692:2096-3004(+)
MSSCCWVISSAMMNRRLKKLVTKSSRDLSARYASSRVSWRMHSGPANKTPASPKMTTSFSVMSKACCVSPMICLSSASSASPSRYLSALSFGVIFSAMNTLTLFRFISLPLKTISRSFPWWCEHSDSVTLLLSMCMSVMTRARLSSEMSLRIASITASSFNPYRTVPSRWYRIPKFSTCVMPSSSGNSTSASMLIHCAASHEFTVTFVRPTGISRLVSVECRSISAEKYPPWILSCAPSFCVSCMIWLHPKGIHSPTRITSRESVIWTSSSSRRLLVPVAASCARCAFDASGRLRSRTVKGK